MNRYLCTLFIVTVSVCGAFALPVSSDKVLHRVVRQFDPGQFLNPNFGGLGGLFSQGQTFQQTGPSINSNNNDNDKNNNNNNEKNSTDNGGLTQTGGSSLNRQNYGGFNFFSPVQFFMPNQNMQGSSASSTSTGGSSPYFAVGVAPFSNLISPSQFINPRDKAQLNSGTSALGVASPTQNFTGNAAGGPDPSGPVGITGEANNGENFQPPGFFLDPGTSF